MNTQKVEIELVNPEEKKEFTVREILASEFDEIQETENPTQRVVKMIKAVSGITDEEYARLTITERTKIVNAMNEVNGWADFQGPKATKEEKKA